MFNFAYLKQIQDKIIDSKKEFEEMLEHEKINLIFKEGLSSKAEANDISGRGLGMDIIYQNITSLGGQIKVTSQKGIGTEFLLTFPLDSEKLD